MVNIDFTQEQVKLMLSAMLEYVDICEPENDRIMGNIIGKLTIAMENEV